MQIIKNKFAFRSEGGFGALAVVTMVSIVSAASIIYLTTKQANVAQFFFNQKMLNERQNILQRAVANLSQKEICTKFMSGKFKELEDNKTLKIVKSTKDPDSIARINLLGGLPQDRMNVSVQITEVPVAELGSDIDFLSYPEQNTYSKKYKVIFNYDVEHNADGSAKMGFGEQFFNALVKPKQNPIKGEVFYYLITSAPYDGADSKTSHRPNDGDCFLEAERTYPDPADPTKIVKEKPIEKICQNAGAHFDGFRCSLQSTTVDKDGIPQAALSNAFNLSEALCDTETNALMRQNPNFQSIHVKRKFDKQTAANLGTNIYTSDWPYWQQKCREVGGTPKFLRYTKKNGHFMDFDCPYIKHEIIDVTDNSNPVQDFGMTMLCQKPRWSGCVDSSGSLRVANDQWQEMSTEMEKTELHAAVEKEILQAQKIKVLRLLPSSRANQVEGLDMIDINLNSNGGSEAASQFQMGQNTFDQINSRYGVVDQPNFSSQLGGDPSKYTVLDKVQQQIYGAIDKSSSMQDLKDNLVLNGEFLVLQGTNQYMPLPQQVKDILNNNTDVSVAKRQLEEWGKNYGKSLTSSSGTSTTASTTGSTTTTPVVPIAVLQSSSGSSQSNGGVTTYSLPPQAEISSTPLLEISIEGLSKNGDTPVSPETLVQAFNSSINGGDPTFKNVPKDSGTVATTASNSGSSTLSVDNVDSYFSPVGYNILNWLKSNTSIGGGTRTPSSTTAGGSSPTPTFSSGTSHTQDDEKKLKALFDSISRDEETAKARAAELVRRKNEQIKLLGE